MTSKYARVAFFLSASLNLFLIGWIIGFHPESVDKTPFIRGITQQTHTLSGDVGEKTQKIIKQYSAELRNRREEVKRARMQMRTVFTSPDYTREKGEMAFAQLRASLSALQSASQQMTLDLFDILSPAQRAQLVQNRAKKTNSQP